MSTAAAALGIIFAVFVLSEGCIYKRDGPSWDYSNPSLWPAIFPACGGRSQSPIDLTNPVSVGGSLQFDYLTAEADLLLFDNTHTVEAEWEGPVVAQLSGEPLNGSYVLQQVHFHSPSEHTINGQRFDLEMHFVHQRSSDNQTAVASLLLQRSSDESTLLSPLAPFLYNVSLEKESVHPEWSDRLSLILLPYFEDFYVYNGSLTAPPCSENVQWVIASTVAQISDSHFAALQHLLHNNSRSTQAGNGRVIGLTTNRSARRAGYIVLGLLGALGTVVLVTLLVFAYLRRQRASDFSRLVEMEMDSTLTSPTSRNMRSNKKLNPALARVASRMRSEEDPEDSEESLAALPPRVIIAK